MVEFHELSEFVRGYVTFQFPNQASFDEESVEFKSACRDCHDFRYINSNELALAETPEYGQFELGADFWQSRNKTGTGYYDRAFINADVRFVLGQSAVSFGECSE